MNPITGTWEGKPARLLWEGRLYRCDKGHIHQDEGYLYPKVEIIHEACGGWSGRDSNYCKSCGKVTRERCVLCGQPLDPDVHHCLPMAV